MLSHQGLKLLVYKSICPQDTFVRLQFWYCSLIWLHEDHGLNHDFCEKILQAHCCLACFDVVAMFGAALWKLLPSMSKTLQLRHKLAQRKLFSFPCSFLYLLFFPFFLICRFNLLFLFLFSLYSFLVKVCIFHKVLRRNEVADLRYRFSKGDLKEICFLVGDSRFLFENFWQFGIARE